MRIFTFLPRNIIEFQRELWYKNPIGRRSSHKNSLGAMAGRRAFRHATTNQERALRGLGLVCARRQAVQTSGHPPQGPSDSPATPLAVAFGCRLQEIQPRVDGRPGGRLYRRGQEASQPAPPWPVGSAHRTTVLGWAAVLAREGTRREPAQRSVKTPANTGYFGIHMGATPESRRAPSSTSPSAQPANRRE